MVAYGPPLEVERLTLWPVAPAEAFQVNATWRLPAVAARPVGGGGALADCTVSEMLPEEPRACESVTANGSVLPPSGVAGATVALQEKTLSPALASPLVPLSTNVCVALPPMELRSATTAMPVDDGFVPGVTVTVSSVVPPGATELGLALPLPAGGVCVLMSVSARGRIW